VATGSNECHCCSSTVVVKGITVRDLPTFSTIWHPQAWPAYCFGRRNIGDTAALMLQARHAAASPRARTPDPDAHQTSSGSIPIVPEGRDPGVPRPLSDLFPVRLVDSELGQIPEGWITIDWTLRENVRAHLRVLVKRILRKHGYPPDKQERATQTVLEQAALLSADWAA
jgi:Domain of unknown function (DUF3387)